MSYTLKAIIMASSTLLCYNCDVLFFIMTMQLHIIIIITSLFESLRVNLVYSLSIHLFVPIFKTFYDFLFSFNNFYCWLSACL